MISSENALLASLGEDDRARVLAAAWRTRLEAPRVLLRPNEQIASVLFPLDGLISIAAQASEGASVEVALVGREGLVGARPLMAGKETFTNVGVRVLVSGDALAVPAAEFLDALERVPAIRPRIEAFLDLQFTQAVQEVACARTHATAERLARWLLHADDRAPEHAFAMTHDLLARALGVRRATVTEAIGSLRDGRMVRTARGQVTIADRAGLEAAACACYSPLAEALRLHLEACLGPAP